MSFTSTISRDPSFARSSTYGPSRWSNSTSSTRLPNPDSTGHLQRPGSSRASTSASISTTAASSNVVPRSAKAAPVRASTVTSATSMSKIIRAAAPSRETKSPSISSTLRHPPTFATRTSEASTLRNSTLTSATTTSKLIRSASPASTVGPLKRAPSNLQTTASRILWGRRPPGHSILKPSHIATLTHTLSLPGDTPMLSSVVGALGVPLSRSQYSSVRSCFCDAHFWFEQTYIAELTEVISHELGPQLDKLRVAPPNLISKKTERLLSTLLPYQDIFTTPNNTRSTKTTTPTCAACTLSRFFQNPKAVKALTTCVKGRKHKARPWPVSMAWLDPDPPKGTDWEAKWKADGKPIRRDRARVQGWRRENRIPTADPPVLGHQPGEGCDFCDALRMEPAEDDEEAAVDDEDDDPDPDSATIRAMREQSVIDAYLPSPHGSVNPDRGNQSVTHSRDGGDTAETRARARGASEWARSYRHLVGREPSAQTTVQIRGSS